ncbi:MAG TPA: hypothetical protein VFP57_10535 [Sphingomicrobium sp.]|nr:hypothetical protein [Sphingomicrobium sp.]
MSSAFSFYAVSAQIIPILFLALAVEIRFYEWRPHHSQLSRANRLFVLSFPIAYVAAEAIAGYALLTGTDTEMTRALCALGVGLCAAPVLQTPLRAWFGRAQNEARKAGDDELLRQLRQDESIAAPLVFGSAFAPGLVLLVAVAING